MEENVCFRNVIEQLCMIWGKTFPSKTLLDVSTWFWDKRLHWNVIKLFYMVWTKTFASNTLLRVSTWFVKNVCMKTLFSCYQTCVFYPGICYQEAALSFQGILLGFHHDFLIKRCHNDNNSSRWFHLCSPGWVFTYIHPLSGDSENI